MSKGSKALNAFVAGGKTILDAARAVSDSPHMGAIHANNRAELKYLQTFLAAFPDVKVSGNEMGDSLSPPPQAISDGLTDHAARVENAKEQILVHEQAREEMSKAKTVEVDLGLA